MTAPPHRGKRFWSLTGSPRLIFRVVVAALLVSTSAGVWYAIGNRSAFQDAFPGAVSNAVYGSLIAVGALSLVALAGLWAWHPWAIVLYGFLAAASVVLDVLARAPVLHQVTVVLATCVVGTLAYVNRSAFHRGGDQPCHDPTDTGAQRGTSP